MSCNYAEGLSPYEHKGVLGLPEKFETPEKLDEKCKLLAQMITEAKHVVVHTGAGISTAAGIPDFRGPNGVWTLEKKGKKPSVNISFTAAKPTKTHMILRKLVECDKVKYIVSQNIDGLHMKSGLPRQYLAELHGNMFVDECNVCTKQYVRSTPVETVGKKSSDKPCPSGIEGRRPCRGKLHDWVLDWEHSLPENDLLMSEWQSSIADLSICLGTTLQIVPSGNLPLETVKYGGKLVICNLQPTKHDNKSDLIINYYVDDILQKVMDILGIDIPTYKEDDNLILLAQSTTVEWTIPRKDIVSFEKIFNAKCKGVKKIRNLLKSKRNSKDTDDNKIMPKISKLNDQLEQNSEVDGISSNGVIDRTLVNENEVNTKLENNLKEKCDSSVKSENPIEGTSLKTNLKEEKCDPSVKSENPIEGTSSNIKSVKENGLKDKSDIKLMVVLRTKQILPK